MQKFVFFNADNATVKVSVDNVVAGYADNATALAQLLKANNVTLADRLMHSSDVDFASEEGFATDDDAHAIIDGAIQLL